VANKHRTHVNRAALENIGRELMQALGYDANEPSTADTPKRWAKWWDEFLNYDDDRMVTTFAAEQIDQLVVVSGIRVWSLCEHHLLPFYCDVAMGYIVQDRALGLSKLGRIAHFHAHTLQVQERLVTQIADHLADAASSPSVAVVARGEHLCMTMRGIKTPSVMTSSAMRGLFRTDAAARAEFLRLAFKD
jgi:GTP cyclohydrolase I